MNDIYTPSSMPVTRYDDRDQQIDLMSSFKEHSNLGNMWKLKIMDAQ